jgi:glycosyltransferase involved in cell wall biosynthesis
MKICIAIYSHPELYPPTLNAVDFLSNKGFSVDLVYNNQFPSTWNYSDTVHLFPVGKMMRQKDLEVSSIFQKVIRWFQFVLKIRRLIDQCDVCIVYDPIPLLSYHIASSFKKKKNKLLWYHNHDIYELSRSRKYSIQWLAAQCEQHWFNRIDIFSLPAVERKVFFPMKSFLGKFFFIPNYPSLAFYSKFENTTKTVDTIRVLFQGNISPNHGIEEMIDLLPYKIGTRDIELVLKGPISPEYQDRLIVLAKNKNALQYLNFVGLTPYHQVAETTLSCALGLAIFSAKDVMNSTLGTASNKIYEYAACGLPVIYYNDAHYKHHLGKYNWAFGTDLSKESLLEILNYIILHHNELSMLAKRDFQEALNFEHYFQAPFETMQTMLKQIHL